MPSDFPFENVALISVTYKSEKLAQHLAHTASLFRHVWIIVNNSQDDTIAAYRQAIPHATIVAQSINAGFGPANNVGFEASRADCQRALFINPDCTISEAAIRLLLEAADTHPDAAIISPIVFSTATQGANLKLRDYGAGYPAGQVRDLPYSHTLPAVIEDACLDGACFLVDSEKFASIGAFDNNIFMYSEEDDISLRVHKSRFRKITVRDAHAQHLGGASSTSSTRVELRKKYHQKWAVFYMLGKHKSPAVSKIAAGKTLLVAPIAILLYALLLQKRNFLKWSGWMLAALDTLSGKRYFQNHI